MRRLKSILTPPATAGRGTRLLTVIAGLVLLSAAGVATAAVTSQRETEIALASQENARQDDGEAMARAAARMAARAAQNSLTPEQRARFSDPSVTDYRSICASSDPADDGFCSGVIFSQLGESGVCAPPSIDDKDIKVSGPALGTLVQRAKAQFDAIPTASAQTLPQLALAALRRAYPCQTASGTTPTIDLGPNPRYLINGAVVPSDLPIWGLAANSIDVQTAEAPGGASVAFSLPTGATPPVFVNDVRLPDGVGLSALRPEMIESRRTLADGSIRVKLKPRPASAAPRSFSGEAIAIRAAATASAQAGGTAPVAGTTRLTVRVSQDGTPFVIGRGSILSVSMTGETAGVRTATVSEMPLTPDSPIGRLVFFDLDDKAFPQRMPGHAYTLKAEIKDSQGRVLYASDPSTLRLAPMSEGQLATLRPELLLKRTALTPS